MGGCSYTTLSYGLNKVINNGMEVEIIVYNCQLLFTLKMDYNELIVPFECFSVLYIITSNSFNSVADLTSENGSTSSKHSSSPGGLDGCPW